MSVKTKNFKPKTNYLINLFLRVLVVGVFLWLFISLNIDNEEEIIELFGERELHGRAKQRGAILLGKYLANNWGKSGIIIASLIMLIGAVYFLLNEFFEFRRFLKKDKLYKQGLVDNLYDDYEPVSLLRQVKTLFYLKGKNRMKSYPSEKEMKEALNKNKYFKNDSNL